MDRPPSLERTLVASVLIAIPLGLLVWLQLSPHDNHPLRDDRFHELVIGLTVILLVVLGLLALRTHLATGSRRSAALAAGLLGLAAVYLLISNFHQRRFAGDDARVITLLHIAIAIAFVTPEQGQHLTAIEAFINREIPEERLEDFQAFTPRSERSDSGPEPFKAPSPVFGRRTKRYSNRL